ncbi:MAG: hypothetical protein QG553_545 [Patescibacteria group bacterium]|nr:hypothetical protein [Patescibacteria group bacterium]
MDARQHLQPLDTSRAAIAASRKRFEEVRIESMNGDSYRPRRQYEPDPVMVDENSDPAIDRIFDDLDNEPEVIDLNEVDDPTLKELIKAETRGEVDNPFADVLQVPGVYSEGATLTLLRAPIFKPQALPPSSGHKTVVKPAPEEEFVVYVPDRLVSLLQPAEPIEKRSGWREKLSGGWKKARTAVLIGGAALVGVAAFNSLQSNEQPAVEEAAPAQSVELSAQAVTALKSQEFADLVQCSVEFDNCLEVIEFAVQVDRLKNAE